jgi:hypothetical protein
MEQWVEGSGADAIAVPLQFFGHLEAEDGAFYRMVQDVQPDQPRVQVTVVHGDYRF